MGRESGGAGRGGGAGGVPERTRVVIEGRYAGAPEAHAALIQETVVRDDLHTPDGDKVRGYYRTGEPGRIYLDANEATESTPRHELGHLIWYERLDAPPRSVVGDEWRTSTQRLHYESRQTGIPMTELGDLKFISAYSTISPAEFWAEAYSQWTVMGRQGRYNRDRIRDRAPRTAEVLEISTGIE